MAPYYSDSESAQAQDRQQTLPTEHTKLLGDQGHDSLYRTLSVRLTPNDNGSNPLWRV